MKMAKPSEKDIDVAGNALSMFDALSDGNYDFLNENEDDDSFDFNCGNREHLEKFHNFIVAISKKSSNWYGRVIGGMCYVIMNEQNELIDPNLNVIELHPKIKAALEFQANHPNEIKLMQALKLAKETLAYYAAGDHIQVDKLGVATSPYVEPGHRATDALAQIAELTTIQATTPSNENE